MQRIMKSFLVFTLFFLGATYCTQKKYSFEGIQSYPYPNEIKGGILNSDFVFSWPTDILVADSLIVINDSYSQEYGLHIFRKSDGQWLQSFCHRGRGPGEHMLINSMSIDDAGNLVIYDPNRKCIISYDLRQILNGNRSAFTEYTISSAPNYLKKALPYGENFVVKGNDSRMRYGYWDEESDSISGAIIRYPKFSKDDETNWSICDYSTVDKISPNKEYLLCATYVGASLELFNLDANEITQSRTKYIFEPIYDYAEGAVPRWVTPTDETVIGFSDVCLTNENIYGLLWGVKALDMESCNPIIIQYDYTLTARKAYKPKEIIEKITVDNNTIYATGIDEKGEYHLYMYQI